MRLHLCGIRLLQHSNNVMFISKWLYMIIYIVSIAFKLELQLQFLIMQLSSVFMLLHVSDLDRTRRNGENIHSWGEKLQINILLETTPVCSSIEIHRGLNGLTIPWESCSNLNASIWNCNLSSCILDMNLDLEFVSLASIMHLKILVKSINQQWHNNKAL